MSGIANPHPYGDLAMTHVQKPPPKLYLIPVILFVAVAALLINIEAISSVRTFLGLAEPAAHEACGRPLC